MNTQYLATKIRLLDHLYMAWYFASIIDLVDDAESDSTIYLHKHSHLDMELIVKFKEIYEKWVGFDMECEEKKLPREAAADWIIKHWED